MFCLKTSVGYFNYLRFVALFPEPSVRRFMLMILLSFSVAIICVSLAAGFDSNASFDITTINAGKICWFTRDVIYYFMTIPACIFLFLNLLLVILVGRRIIQYVRNATTPHQTHRRMQQCVVVLLSSCIAQGVGWFIWSRSSRSSIRRQPMFSDGFSSS